MPCLFIIYNKLAIPPPPKKLLNFINFTSKVVIISKYLGNFSTNYIIFKNDEISPQKIFIYFCEAIFLFSWNISLEYSGIFQF
jgi:hypothetical protein